MKLRTTLILLAVLAVVGGAWWLTRGLTDAPPEEPADTTPEPTALFPEGTLDLAKIDRFDIVRPDGSHTTFTKNRGRWWITYPVWFSADDTTVRQLLQSVAALRDLGPAEPGGEANPTATISLYGDGDTRVILFDDTLGGGLGRVRVDNRGPRLVGDVLHDFLKRYDPVDLLSNQLNLPNAYNTLAFTLTTRDDRIEFRQHDGRWFIDDTYGQPVLDEPVEGCIDIAGYLNIPNATKIERFVPVAVANNNPTAYGLDDPEARVRIDYFYNAGDGQTRSATLTIGAPADPERNSYYAAVSEPGQPGSAVFVLPAEFSIVLSKTMTDFIDPRVYSITPAQVGRVELLGAWSLPLADERGSLIDPRRARSGSYAELRSVLEPLLSARSRDYQNYWETRGRWREAARLRIVPTLGGEPELVTFFKPAPPSDTAAQEPGDTDYLALREHESVGMRIPAELVEALIEVGDLDLPFEAAVRE